VVRIGQHRGRGVFKDPADGVAEVVSERDSGWQIGAKKRAISSFSRSRIDARSPVICLDLRDVTSSRLGPALLE
jgi:hypothetical protein